MSMTGVISGAVTPKDKNKSNHLARLKVRIFSKSVIGFWSFPLSEKEKRTKKELSDNTHPCPPTHNLL